MSEGVVNNKRIAKNTIFLYIRLFFVLLISLYTVRVVLKALGVIDYGIYNVVGGFASMFSFFCTTMSNATQRFYNYEIGKNGYTAVTGVFNAAIRVQIVFALIVFILGELVGVWYINNVMVIPEERLFVANWIYQFSLFLLILTIIQVPYVAAIMAYEKLDFYAIVGIVDAVFKLFIAIFIAKISYDRLLIYGLLLFLIGLVNIALYIGYCKKFFEPIKIKSNYDKKMGKAILSFSGWNILGAFSFMTRNQGVNVLINAFFGATINTANGIAGQVSGALQTFTSNIIIAFKPQLIQSYAREDYARTQQLFFEMSKVSYVLVLIFSVPLILEMQYILDIWLGGTVPAYTLSFSRLSVVSILISIFHIPIVQIMHATGKVKKFQLYTSVVILAILPLSWICLYIGLPPEFVYWSTIGVFIINQIVGLYVLHQNYEYKYSDYVKIIVIPCAITTILLLIIPCITYQLMNESFFRMVIICGESLIIGILLSYVIILNNSEKQYVNNIINKLLNKNKL